MGLAPASVRSAQAKRPAAPVSAKPFQPLNPERHNPFVYGGELTTTSIEATPTRLSKTVVMGFITTDQPCVVLSLHGRSHILSVGQSVGTITVERIAPPTVTLRSGHSTWTASMFDL